MNSLDAVESSFKGSLEAYLHILSTTYKADTKTCLNDNIVPMLREYGASILTNQDLNLIKK